MGAVVALIALVAAGRAVAADVFVVHSYHKTYGWDRDWRNAINRSLSEHDLTHFYLNSKRLSEKEYRKRADRAWSIFQKKHFDAVILGDDNALRFLGPRIASTSSIPVIFLGINANPAQYFEGANLPATVTGALERPQLGLNVRLVQSLMPETDRILILMDEGPTGDAAYEQVQNMRQATGRIDFAVRQLRDFAAWKRHVRTAASNGFDVIVPALYFRQKNRNGKTVPGDRVIRWTHRNTPVPLIGFWRFAIGPKKAMAGVVLHGEKMGEQAAAMLKTVFRTGRTPPPEVVHGGKTVISRSGLKRWDVELHAALQERAEILP